MEVSRTLTSTFAREALVGGGRVREVPPETLTPEPLNLRFGTIRPNPETRDQVSPSPHGKGEGEKGEGEKGAGETGAGGGAKGVKKGGTVFQRMYDDARDQREKRSVAPPHPLHPFSAPKICMTGPAQLYFLNKATVSLSGVRACN